MKMHATAIALLSAAVCAVAVAASIHVMPTTLTLGPGKAAAVLTVTNEGDAPIRTQVRVFEWQQTQGKDALVPTQKVVASPPMATLAPKQTQAIRVVRVDKSPATREEAYRVVVDEIPDPASAPAIGVAVQMRYSVPVFVMPKASMPPASVTVTAQLRGNQLTLQAKNPGESHAQASNVILEHDGGGTTPVVNGLLGYVLPGQTMQWTLDVPANAAAKGRPVRVDTSFNGQPFKVDL